MNNTGEAKELRWNCLFPAENGAFFLNYVLTSAFLGNVIEMIRVSEVASYALAIFFLSRTSAEYLTARQMTKFEFYFGTYYPRILLLFTLIVTFSISSPLIAPIGEPFPYFNSISFPLSLNYRPFLPIDEAFGGQVSHISFVCSDKNQSKNTLKGHTIRVFLTTVPLVSSLYTFGGYGSYPPLLYGWHRIYNTLFVYFL